MKEYLLCPSLVDLPLLLLMYTIKLIMVANTIIASNASMTILTVTGNTIFDEEFCGEDAVVLLVLIVLELKVQQILVAIIVVGLILVVKLAVGLILAVGLVLVVKLVMKVVGIVFVGVDLVDLARFIIMVVLVVSYFSELVVVLSSSFWVVHDILSVTVKRSNMKIIVARESRYFCLYNSSYYL